MSARFKVVVNLANMTVVRNNPHVRGEVGGIENHNERNNEIYSNLDVMLEHSKNNIHFKKCEDTYLQTFDKMVEDKIISTRGLKSDAKIIGEMIFDVNTRYFEENGGYDFAKKFYEDAYNFSVNLVGGEEFILSAVMHADERNKAISDELGKDVFHYHLHVVYVPVVDKEIKYSKRWKDKSMVGKTKEIVKQVSHSKKWDSTKTQTADGKTVYQKSYSKLQDDFWEHMRTTGYEVERGEKGSTAENLTVLEYKTQQENIRLQDLILQAMSQKEVLDEYERKIKTKKDVIKLGKDLKDIGKPTLLGNEVKLSNEDFKKLKRLAKKGIDMQDENEDLKKELVEVKKNFNAHATAHNKLVGMYNDLQSQFDDLQKEFKQFKEKMKPYLDTVKYAPEKVKAVIREVLGLVKREKKRDNIGGR